MCPLKDGSAGRVEEAESIDKVSEGGERVEEYTG